MGLSKSDMLTTRFYEWEARGRGWHVFPFPVELEPEFHPFYGHFTPAPLLLDDSRHPTLLSNVFDFLKGRKPHVGEDNSHLVKIPPVTGCAWDFEPPIAYKIVLPKGEKVEIEDMEHLFLMLSYTDYPVSFEIVGTGEAISLQFTCREKDEANVCAQIGAYFPAAIVTKSKEGLDILLDDTETCIIDFGLKEEFMRPIRTTDDRGQDPYIGLFATLEHLKNGESGIIQVLFKGTRSPWAESIMRAVTDSAGGSFFENDPDMVKLARDKVSAPLFSVAIRAIGQSNHGMRAQEITRDIVKTLMRLTQSRANALQPLSEDGYPIDDKIRDVFLRDSHRIGMLLNSRELATVAHFPTSGVASKKVERNTRKTKGAPESTQGHKFTLGMNSHHGVEQAVTVPASLRLRHTHIIGATGTGKSTLLLSMIAQDMQLGNGIAVLDPHGDLIESILAYVPKERMDDVILIDPADGEYPVGFNILSAHSEIEKDILSSDLVAAFRRLSTSWGDQMNSVFANAILAFLESKEGGTLVDLRRFLVEKPFRDAYLKTVTDPHITYYWLHEYPLLKSSSLGSILTRLDTFLRPKLIRNMVAQRKGLDFEHILNSKKILLIKLSQGLIGAENSFLLGTFFVSKIYQAAMARQAKSKDSRQDFFFYIDEFQHYSTPSMSHILSGARKYGLGLILAHQDMEQLKKFDTELASSVVVNAATRICFRLGDTDAKRFASGFSYFDAQDLENLRTGEAIARIEQPNFDFSLNTVSLPEIPQDVAEAWQRLVIAKSREKYGTEKAAVEKSLEHIGKIVPVQQEAPVAEAAKPPKPAPKEQFVPVVLPTVTAPPKKEETEHRYLQMLIKRMAQSRGFKAEIEKPTADGKGFVDVSIERDGKKIACEISVTTEDAWEMHNVEKCLAAGYDGVIVCSNNGKTLAGIRKMAESKIDKKQFEKLQFLSSDEVIQFLDRQAIPDTPEVEVIKGFRVRVEYDSSTPEDTKDKQGNVAKTIANSLKKRGKS